AEIVEPTLSGMRNLGQPYCGFLHIGVIVDENGKLFLIDYNCRICYPETEVIAPRIVSSLAELLSAAANGRLNEACLVLSDQVAVCVTLMSEGYPGKHKAGAVVTGIEQAR